MRNYKRNLALVSALLVCKAGAFAQVDAEQGKKYNVLFIASDDLNTDMHTYGDPLVKTPNIDRISKMGTRFDRAYNQYPFSGPSRASLMTGYRPDKVGVHDLRTNFRDIHPTAVTIAQLFKQNGYYTGRVGKIFHYGVPDEIGTNGMDDELSWNQRFNPIGVDKTEEHKVTNHTPNRGLGSSLSFMAMDGTDNEHTDAMVANTAVQMMRQQKDKPFFLAVGFFRPHCPYIAPKKYFDMYPLDQIQLPEERADDWDNKPEAAKFTNPLHWGLNENQRREVMQAYYASITFMDAQVGKLLDALEELGLMDNTIIVFWSDHGYNVGQHGQWMKQSLFEHTARTPLLISAPGVTNGTPTNRIVEFIDIYPTLAELCNLSAPRDLDGRSLVPLLKDSNMKWDYSAFTQVYRISYGGQNQNRARIDGRSIRTDKYRYTEWDKGDEGLELYDYETDPLEFNNLAHDEKHKKIVENMSKQLRDSYK